LPGPSLIASVSPPHKQPKGGSLFNSRFFVGLWTNRNPMRSPLGAIYADFYRLGATDALIDGQNVELTTRLTLARRPGNTVYSTAVLLDVPDAFYSFHEFTTNSIVNSQLTKIICDTPSAIYSLGTTSSTTTLIGTKGNMVSNPFLRGGQVSGFGTGASNPAQGQYGIFDTNISGKVSLSVVQDTTVPSGFQTKLQISTSASGPAPGLGGFSYGLIAGHGAINSDTYKDSTNYIVSLMANIPSGFTLNFSAGSLGTGGSFSFITPQAGTGNWTTYQVSVTTGTGTAGSNAFPFFYLTGTTPVTWAIDGLMVTDQTLAGQTTVQAVTNTLYMGDGIEQTKWNDTVISPPVQPILSQTAGGANPMTTYFVTTTYVNASSQGLSGLGETTQSQEASFVVSASNFLVVTAPSPVSGASGWNVNISTTTGTETRQNLTLLPFSSSFTLNVALISGLLPPTVNTAQYVTQWGIIAPAAAPTVTSVMQGTFITTAMTSFDGATSYVSTANKIPSGNNQPPGSLTIGRCPIVYEVIFKTSAAASQVLMGIVLTQTGFTQPGDYFLWLDSGGHVSFTVGSGPSVAPFTVASVTPYNDGQVHHAVVSCTTTGHHNDTAVAIYVDGKLVAFNPVGMAARPNVFNFNSPPGGWLRIGAGGSTTSDVAGPAYFNGTLSRATFYFGTQFAGLSNGQFLPSSNRITGLSSNHYNTLVNSGLATYDTAVLKDNPTNYWKLNETVGTTANDTQGRNQGTYQGSVTLNVTTTVFNGTWLANTVYATNATIVDSNGNTQKATTGGTSGAIQPAWAAAIAATTQDNTVVWTNMGPFGLSPTSPSGYIWGFAYKNSVTQHYSSMSARSAASGPGEALYVTLSGPASPDPQVDLVAIFRTGDGGGTLLEDAEIANPPSGQNWQYNDANADITLNPLILAPEGGVNNPPPTGFIAPTYHMQRMWGAVGSVVYASGGPDTSPGSGNEAFPGITFTFPSQVIRLESINSGVLVYTTDDVWIIDGGPGVTTFFARILLRGLGLLSYNAMDKHGATYYFYTADKKFVSFDTGSGISQIGFPISDQFFANFNPTQTYAAFHTAGDQDKALFVGDGSTGWFRCNPQQAPDWGTTGPVWSPKANIVGGAKALASIPISPGQYRLLIGPTLPGNILMRDSSFSTFTDAGQGYSAFATIGSIVLADPGEIAGMNFLTCDFIKVGISPRVLVLLDEISGAFEDLSGYVISDPPLLYGPTGQPNTLYSNRYAFTQTVSGGTPLPAWCRHLQIRLDFGQDVVQNEILSLTINGKRWIDE
jgi:hypothetical protein